MKRNGRELIRPTVSRRRCERGSALLIVFVFAAMVAIMLYTEMPVVVFEAQRAKEQLLVDRGNEYAHAVKLFFRKMRNYPASIDALENTNRIRFLRHRFKDPFTGADDWRLLHAGPGGAIIDSKVNPIRPGTSGSNSSLNGFGANGQMLASPGSSDQNGTPQEAPVAQAAQQRPPAISANPSGPLQGGPPPDPTISLLPPLSQDPMNSQNEEPTGGSSANQGAPNGQQMINTANGQIPGGEPPAGVPGAANPMQAVQPLLTNPNPTGATALNNGNGTANPIAPGSGQGNTAVPQVPGPIRTAVTRPNSTMGTIISGGIAGVASKADGASIKIVNDQKKYSLWEFFYDPTKDTMRGVVGNTLPGTPQSSGISTGFQQTPLFPNGQTQNNTQSTTGQGSTQNPNNPSNPNTPPNPNNPLPDPNQPNNAVQSP